MTDKRNVQGAIEFTIETVNESSATGLMPIRQDMLNPYGTVHAGALIWFADVIATTLVLAGVEPSEGMESFPVAVTLNAQLLSNRNSGQLVATAQWVKRGRRVSTVRTLVADGDGKVLLDLTSTHVSAK
ncbi:MAG: PaaI family thioesterase [Methyloligellaceae bacterium]